MSMNIFSRASALLVKSSAASRVAMPAARAAAFSTHAPPHGGKLVDLMVKDEAEKSSLASAANHKIELNDRQSCDVELIINGGFSPIDGFMNQDEYAHVVENMRLKNGLLFGLPVVMDTHDDSILPGQKVLFTYKGKDIAVMDVDDRFVPDKALETLEVLWHQRPRTPWRPYGRHGARTHLPGRQADRP